MRLIVLDTCLAACQAAVIADGAVLACLSDPMARGHQERLAPMVREVMEGARLSFGDLDRIAVTVGPGSFTGLRVGLAFAKGLALALDRPCVGVGTLAALAASLAGGGARAAVIDAGRGSIYLQRFDGRAEMGPPEILPLETADLAHAGALIGPSASRFAGPGQVAVDRVAPSLDAIAELAVKAPTTPASPLYLRAPDAKVKAR
ncbi:MAG TPA: tRNA (adenosine(37)-N6)-threonylcarbamoyltransferase complex dimerization subunit type 1 TsaB [Caulobacteraceae bacterium]